MNDELSRNAHGYSDPTAYQALKHIEKEEERFHKMLRVLFDIMEISGFRMDGRATFVDKRTGRIWR